MGKNGLDIPTIASYFGGKTRLAPTLIEFISKAKGTTIFGEIFGGMACTLLNKPPHPTEIYNDLSVENYSIFKCFASPDLSNTFIDRILQSEYSEETYNFYRVKYDTEFKDKIKECMDAILAGALPDTLKGWREDNILELGVTNLILTKMSPRGLMTANSFAGFYTGLEAQEYENWKLNLYTYADRLKNARIMNRDALQIIREYANNPNAVFLCDSPYYGENTGSDSAVYNTGAATQGKDKSGEKSKTKKEKAAEDDKNFQIAYMSAVQNVKCKIIVCGYKNDLYPKFLTPELGWKNLMVQEQAKTAKNTGRGEMRDRVEEWVWVNYDIS